MGDWDRGPRMTRRTQQPRRTMSVGAGTNEVSRPSATSVADAAADRKGVMDMEEESPPKGRAEKARRWLSTVAVLISALMPLVLRLVEHYWR